MEEEEGRVRDDCRAAAEARAERRAAAADAAAEAAADARSCASHSLADVERASAVVDSRPAARSESAVASSQSRREVEISPARIVLSFELRELIRELPSLSPPECESWCEFERRQRSEPSHDHAVSDGVPETLRATPIAVLEPAAHVTSSSACPCRLPDWAS